MTNNNQKFLKYFLLTIFTFLLQYSLLFSECATHARLHINKDSLANKIREKMKLNEIQNDFRGERDFLQKYYDSPNGKFRIHYDTTGPESVSNIDLNKNFLPDYIDSVVYYIEKAYDFQVKTLGYIDPTLRDGRFENNGGSDAYDIYIRQLGDYKSAVVSYPGPYGYVTNGDVYDIIGNVTRHTSFMVIDNDYSILDTAYKEDEVTLKRAYFTTGIEALKITLAHEFHHSIQFFYTISPYMIFPEIFSTFMEWRMYPEVKDYTQYIRRLLNSESSSFLQSITDSRNYNYSTFATYTYLLYGDEFWVKFWERYGKGEYDFRILENLLNEKNTSLKETWVNYTQLFYQTNFRYEDSNILIDAKDWPAIRFVDTTIFSSPSINLTLPMRPFTFSASRVIFRDNEKNDDNNFNQKSNDTLDLFIINSDTTSILNYEFNTSSRYNFDIVNNNFATNEFEKLGNTNYYLRSRLDSTKFNFFTYLYEGSNTKVLNKVIPNPINYNQLPNAIVFPVKSGYPLYKKAKIEIYTIDLIKVYDHVSEISNYEIYRGIVLNPNEINLNSGTYIFKVEIDNEVELGKFAVVNK